GIHRLRRHHPLIAVDRRSQPIDFSKPLEPPNGLQITDKVVGPNLQGGVVAPLGRIGDLDIQPRELFQRFDLGFLAHPSDSLDAAFKGQGELLDKCRALRLGSRRKIARRIDPADRLSHGAIDSAHPALPALRDFKYPAKGLAAKIEIRGYEAL